MTTTTTDNDRLDRISEAIDTFCVDVSNFDDDGTISERGTLQLVSFLEKSVAEAGDDLDVYAAPRGAVLASIGAIEEYRDADGVTHLRNNGKYTRAEIERAWHDAGFDTPWEMTDFLPKLKKGTPPHLSKEEVCGMLIAHSIVAAEYRGRERGEALYSVRPRSTATEDE
jgi:hypothetical protein